MQKTKIEWVDYSSNPVKFLFPEQNEPINFCVPVSPGCAHCYASSLVNRFGGQGHYKKATMDKATCVIVEKEIESILKFKPNPPFKNGQERAKVFPCDMTDLFGEFVPFEIIDRVLAAFALRDDMDFMVLTKRPENVPRMWTGVVGLTDFGGDWVLKRLYRSNIWLGASVEDQPRADERREHLKALRDFAPVLFVSYEPALGPVDWTGWEFLNWMVIGGESGPDARPFDLQWARDAITWCRENDVAPFMKQIGSNAWLSHWEKTPAPLLVGGPDSIGFRLETKNPKGGSPKEWSSDLQDCRNFPEPAMVESR